MKLVGDAADSSLTVSCYEAISNLASFNPNNKQARAIHAMASLW